jgi:cytochrome c oxidase assembly protein subunit 15
MGSARASRWLNRFIWFTAAATLLLICSGGMVTSKGVGLAVPDWPTTFGYNMFLFPVSKWVGGVFFEHTHRLIASIVGFLTVILTVWIGLDDDRRWVRRLGFFALVAVILQGVLGGLRVTLLKDQIGVFHACLAQAFLGLLVFIGSVRSNLWRSSTSGIGRWQMRRFAAFAAVATVLIYGQMALGATMRHEHKDLAILDFPTANNSWWPDTTPTALAAINAWRDARGLSDVTAFQIWLQMAHRFGAVLITVAVLLAIQRLGSVPGKVPALKILSFLWVAFLFTQVTLGAWTIWSNKAADVATTHVAVGAVMLSLGVALTALGFHLSGTSAGIRAQSAARQESTVLA